MIEYFIDLLNYNHWANSLIMESLKKNRINGKALELISHIILSQIIWLQRVKNEAQSIENFWEILPINKLENLHQASTNDWLNYLSEIDEDGLNQKINYKNTKGNSYANTLSQIITHVINHSSYHRAQINMLLRQNNCQPESIDYIVYKRN
ncbi:DinB family protein [Melioribacteraceae bacterium 4301-Me]|uniref:DinB family protein n=1 Tax=Pyranulibacter aquaticus TaxID=3163344 RepID=UPI003595E832